MRESTYSALFGAMSNEFRLNEVTNNLANVNTTGYKQDQTAFHDTFLRFAHDYLVDGKSHARGKDMFPKGDVMAKPRLSDQLTDFTQGSLQPTGNTLDFAITGDGFFKVDGPGGEVYTRAGRFQMSTDGTLITEQGYPVLGGGSPVVLPQGGGAPVVNAAGEVFVEGEQVAQIDMVTVDNKSALEKLGRNTFRIQPNMAQNAQEIPAENARMEQGMIEKANVEVVTEMVSMIEAQRAFQMYTKMMQSTDSMENMVINRVGGSR
ncbi:MAG: flagellar basal-body rod protein FlgF [Desulfovibrio sp.]